MTNHNQADLDQLDQLPDQAAARGEDNEKRVINALQKHGASRLPGLMNREERQLVQDHLIAELSQGFEHRRIALGMILDTRLQSVKEACNHVLVTGKAHLRQQRAQSYTTILRQLEKDMNAVAEEFLEDVDQRLVRLDRYKSEALRDREKIRLERSVDTFLSMLDQLMDEFREIISESVGANQGNFACESGN